MRTRIALALFAAWSLSVVVGPAGADDLKSDEKMIDLKVGDTAPAFEVLDDMGRRWKSADIVGKKYLVVYFYPADFTAGCRAQAQKFRDNMNKLADQGIIVVGVSADSVYAHALFRQAEKLNFPLLADEDGAVAKKFGVPLGKGGEVRAKDTTGKLVVLKRAMTASRWTFIVGLDGKVVYKNTKVNPVVDSQQVSDFIAKLQPK